MRPLAIDLFTGLHGWGHGLVAEGWRVVGFDLEDMCGQFGVERPEHVSLVIQDVRTLDGSQFKSADLLVASPPCQFFSYCAMPWSKAKALAAEVRADPERLAKELELFNTCFRIQREASEAAGRHIPMIVENVRGAIPWVGRSRYNFGSFHLWADVPALMPSPIKATKVPGFRFDGSGKSFQTESVKVGGLDWSRHGEEGYKPKGFNVTAAQRYRAEQGVKQRGSGASWFDNALDERRREATAVKNGNDWFGSGPDCSLQRRSSSKSDSRKAASAMIAKIPLVLARHIGRVFHPAHPQE